MFSYTHSASKTWHFLIWRYCSEPGDCICLTHGDRTLQTLIMFFFFLWRLWVFIESPLWCSDIVQDMFLSSHCTYHSAGQGCDVYPASILPYWRHPAHNLVKWPFFSPTRWGPGRTHIQTPPTLQDRHRQYVLQSKSKYIQDNGKIFA